MTQELELKFLIREQKLFFSDVGSVRATGYTTDLNHAMNVARNYFLSGQVSNWNKSCSQKLFNCYKRWLLDKA